MKLRYLTAMTASALTLALAPALASAQDNPLLQQADNPLLQQAEPNADTLFEQEARAIDAAATREASDPTCQNIRTNYNQKLAEITEKSGQSSTSLSSIGRMSSKTNSAGYRIQNISRNVTGKRSGAVGSATGAIGKGTSVVNDAAQHLAKLKFLEIMNEAAFEAAFLCVAFEWRCGSIGRGGACATSCRGNKGLNGMFTPLWRPVSGICLSFYPAVQRV